MEKQTFAGSLIGRKAIVCGSSRGIGLACAQTLSQLGAEVACVARDGELLKKAVATLSVDQGQRHRWVAADLMDARGITEKIGALLKDWHPVQILVNNSGGPPPGPILEARPEDFLKALSGDLIANHILTQLVLEGMKACGYGRIINILSTSVRQPIKNLGVSNTVRAAVANWAKTAAGETALLGITVNNILPGFTSTERLKSLFLDKARRSERPPEEVERECAEEVPMRRFAEPREIAQAVGFLASPWASYINGIDLTVDGGRLAVMK